eukprot:scaffold15517_cov114-Isochrysis_galbana.AAC.5
MEAEAVRVRSYLCVHKYPADAGRRWPCRLIKGLHAGEGRGGAGTSRNGCHRESHTTQRRAHRQQSAMTGRL